MDELQQLVIEQQRDKYQFKVPERIDRPYVYRFPCFAGDTPRQKAYSVLRYCGWHTKDINKALRVTIDELCDDTFDFEATYKPENYQKFFFEIPEKHPRHKAILILRGLYWYNKDIASALGVCSRTVERTTKPLRDARYP